MTVAGTRPVLVGLVHEARPDIASEPEKDTVSGRLYHPPASGARAGAAGATAEHPPGLVGAIAAGHRQVCGAPLAMLGAVGIQAAEARQVVHGVGPAVRSSGWTPS